jgi:cyanate lyase
MSNKEASDLSYEELKELLEKKKQERLTTLHVEITELKSNLTSKQAELAELTGAPVAAAHAEAPKRRGRPVGSGKKNAFNGPSETKSRGQRGAVGEAIRAFVLSKGKAGAKVKEIAEATGYKPANVTAFFYSKANKKAFKKVAPATFASTGK